MAVNLLSDFTFQKLGETRIWLDRRWIGNDVVETITDPDRFFERPDCRIIKDQPKIKVGRVSLEINQAPTGVYIKRYNAFSWRYRVKSLFCASGAVRSLSGAMLLSQAGVLIARPLAAIESRRWGMLTKSFLLSEEIVAGKTIDVYWRENLDVLGHDRERRRGFLADLATLFRRLHEGSIYHNDLKDANILVKSCGRESENFYLLDLEGVRRCRYLSRRRRVKNIVQLNHTFGKYLRGSEKLHFLKSYLGTSFAKREEQRHWVRTILEQSRRWDRHREVKNSMAGIKDGSRR